MIRFSHLLGLAYVCLAFPAAGLAQSHAASAMDAPVSIATMDSTRQFDFQSVINGETYRVQLYIPRRAPPVGGYPSIYVLDGNALFGTFAEAVRNRGLAGEIEPAVIVGIASGEGKSGADRTLDFTAGGLSPTEKKVIKDLGTDPRFGGSERFLRVIQEEIKPRIATLVHVDAQRTGIFGWSLGGLFVVHTLFSHPEAFQTYLAISPSVWRDDRATFREVPEFERRIAASGLRPRLFLGVGGLEEEARPGFLAEIMSYKELVAEMHYVRMVRNTTDLAQQLSGFFGSHGMALASRVFAGDTHNSVPWNAVNPVLDFALQGKLERR